MGHYIYGKNSVQAALNTHPERVFKLFFMENAKPDKRIDAIYQLAQTHGIPFQQVPRQKLEGLLHETPDANHQGVVASVAPKKLLDIQDVIEKTRPLIEAGQHPILLMLDGITDPRNFGAILRVADAGAVAGVIIPKHHSAGFTPVVSKAASGAEETVDVAVVPNLANSLKKLKDAGYWIVGTSNQPKSQDYFKQDFKMPTVLVLGSEGEGMSQLIEKSCDFLVKIPMLGSVDSLNVSAATAVLVFETVRQHQ